MTVLDWIRWLGNPSEKGGKERPASCINHLKGKNGPKRTSDQRRPPHSLWIHTSQVRKISGGLACLALQLHAQRRHSAARLARRLGAA
jgi:hypothetical protein